MSLEPSLPAAPWRVFYYKRYGLPTFAERLHALGRFELQGITPQTPAPEADAILARAHVYQASSGVNEIEPGYLVGEALLERTPSLLAVSTIGAGYDTVDLEACTRHGIVCFNQSGGANAQGVVEHTLAMMLALGKRLVEAHTELHRTSAVDRHRLVGTNLQGKTVGIVGFGHVGRRLARLCAVGFDARVLVYSRHAGAQALREAGAESVSLDQLLEQSDYVAICCSLSDETRGLIGPAQFQRMKPGAFFVTAARGGIHDEQALLQALQSGHLAGAGVDVWDVEPPPPDHPLLQLPNVIGTPHTGGATVESRIEASTLAAEQIAAAMRAEKPANLLNPEAWPRFLERLAALRPG